MQADTLRWPALCHVFLLPSPFVPSAIHSCYAARHSSQGGRQWAWQYHLPVCLPKLITGVPIRKKSPAFVLCRLSNLLKSSVAEMQCDVTQREVMSTLVSNHLIANVRQKKKKMETAGAMQRNSCPGFPMATSAHLNEKRQAQEPFYKTDSRSTQAAHQDHRVLW